MLPCLMSVWLCACSKQTESLTPARVPASAASTNELAPAVNDFAKLKGEWLRPDGGYILEIRSVAASGRADVAYRNPNPIHVARAEVSKDGSSLKLFVELQDVNYPGSTYTLTYQPESDRLAGNYFQAVYGENFAVEFLRMSAP